LLAKAENVNVPSGLAYKRPVADHPFKSGEVATGMAAFGNVGVSWAPPSEPPPAEFWLGGRLIGLALATDGRALV